MDIIFQYYNEIVLAFKDYDVDYKSGEIIIEIPDSQKPFDTVCEKVNALLLRIADTLEPRDKSVIVRLVRGAEQKELLLEKEVG